MENEELSKKLAEFWGFKYDPWLGWIYPDGENFDTLPDLTESLDACFKWLVPMVLKKSGEDATLELLTEWVQSLILTYTIDQAPSILAKAIEQLIKEK